MFEVEQTPSFDTGAPGHYQPVLSEREIIPHKRCGKDAHFSRKGLLYSDKSDNAGYDVPSELNLTHHGWKDLMTNIPGLLQEKSSTSEREGS